MLRIVSNWTRNCRRIQLFRITQPARPPFTKKAIAIPRQPHHRSKYMHGESKRATSLHSFPISVRSSPSGDQNTSRDTRFPSWTACRCILFAGSSCTSRCFVARRNSPSPGSGNVPQNSPAYTASLKVSARDDHRRRRLCSSKLYSETRRQPGSISRSTYGRRSRRTSLDDRTCSTEGRT